MDKNSVNILLKIEDAALFLIGIFGYFYFGGSWIFILPLLLLPDVSMIGYGINNKVGAIAYNVFHTYSFPIILFIVGFFTKNEMVVLLGFTWLSHISLDRVFSYGLKYGSFKETHLTK